MHFRSPPYSEDWIEQDPKAQSFASFRLWVNGKPTKFQTEAKAFLNGKDVTPILKADRIDVASFGHTYETNSKDFNRIGMADFERLSKVGQMRLDQLGLLVLDQDFPRANWTVHLQYHWPQTFPAHSTVHIRHEYSPVLGFTQVTSEVVDDVLAHPNLLVNPSSEEADGIRLLTGFCANRPFLSDLARNLDRSKRGAQTPDQKLFDGIAYPAWVDFILTSANTWKRPIQDFTLIVERGAPLDGYGKPMPGRHRLISFCSPQNAPVKRLAKDRFEVHLTDFVPKTELHIGFFDFDLPSTRPQAQRPKK